ncbi:MAG: addiction module protein [Kiritimatiellae bacterium]|nr:addiction module protein [Kiritimatiellia bacterium]MCO5067849.1 addiction module protein [Kiritimatiellia bacterium]
MTTAVEKIVSAALDLPQPLRALLAEKLIESLDAQDDAPLSAKWKKEIKRRCAEIDRGSATLIEADKAFARAFASLP